MSCSSDCVAPVGFCLKRHTANITPQTAGAYAVGDVIGTSGSELITLSSAAAVSGHGEIVSIKITEKGTTLQKKGIRFVFMDAIYTSASDDAPFVFPPAASSLTDTNLQGVYSLATSNYSDVDAISPTKYAVAHLSVAQHLNNKYFIADSSGNIYLNLVADEIVTYPAATTLFVEIYTRYHKI